MTCDSHFGVARTFRYVAWHHPHREWRACGSSDSEAELRRMFGTTAVILRMGEVPGEEHLRQLGQRPAPPRQDGQREGYRYPHGQHREQMEAGAAAADDGQGDVEERWRRWAERDID